jgi:catechol 2,3-dioxygenase-like lactoylglutathione lyase family enzyme
VYPETLLAARPPLAWTCQGHSLVPTTANLRHREGVGSRPVGKGIAQMDMKLEVVIIPVSDVDRAVQFYRSLDWRLDADISAEATFRVVQLTPPGSPTAIIFGTGVTTQAPGSAEGLHLVVDDIDAASKELLRQGVDVSEIFHDAGGLFHHAGTEGRLPGPDPDRQSYGSFLSFSDPDGNGWVLQEITTRLPGRVDPAATDFTSARDLANALRRAATAHGQHETRSGTEDPDWPDWYADYMVREQDGRELPS